MKEMVINFCWLIELFGPERSTGVYVSLDGETSNAHDALRYTESMAKELAPKQPADPRGEWRATEHGFYE